MSAFVNELGKCAKHFSAVKRSNNKKKNLNNKNLNLSSYLPLHVSTLIQPQGNQWPRWVNLQKQSKHQCKRIQENVQCEYDRA